jgi:hypothetical protein
MEEEQKRARLAWIEFVNVLVEEFKIKEMLNFLTKVINKWKKK